MENPCETIFASGRAEGTWRGTMMEDQQPAASAPSLGTPGEGWGGGSSAGGAQQQADPRTRFTDRVEAYVRHRPSYPDDVVRFLESIGLARPGMTVADIGSGTGISAQLFLRNGYRVIGVEPNAAMRAAAERLLATELETSAFRSVNGSAEATTLPDASVDLVVAGQAFHWFDRPAARREFHQILRQDNSSNGGVALFWNSRDLTGSA